MNVVMLFIVSVFLYRLQNVIYKHWWDKNLTVELSFMKSSVYEGETVVFSERVSNGKWLRLPYVSVRYRISNKLTRLADVLNPEFADVQKNESSTPAFLANKTRTKISIFTVPMRKTITKKTVISCGRRGYYKIDGMDISSGDILLSDTFTKHEELALVLTVYPKLIEIDETVIPYKKLSGELLAKRFILPDPFEFIGVREYQPYDSMRQLNYKAWAKTGELKSNIYGYTVSQHITIFLNTKEYGVFDREFVQESAIRLAAFLARYYIESGIPVAFVTSGADSITDKPSRLEKGLSTRHLYEIYGMLARIDLTKPAAPLMEVIDSVQTTGDDVMIIISAYHDDNMLDWFSESSQLGSSVLWIVPYAAGDKVTVPPYENMTLWEVEYE